MIVLWILKQGTYYLFFVRNLDMVRGLLHGERVPNQGVYLRGPRGSAGVVLSLGSQ